MQAHICWSGFFFSLQSLHILQDGRAISCPIYDLKLSYQPVSLIFVFFLGSLSEEIEPWVYAKKKKNTAFFWRQKCYIPIPYLIAVSLLMSLNLEHDFSVIHFRTPQTFIWSVGMDGLSGPITSKTLRVNVWQSYFIPACGADHIIQSSTNISDERNFTCER